MRKGYFVAHIDVNDPDEFQVYLGKSAQCFKEWGGRVIVDPLKHEVVEGDWNPERFVIIEFPSYENARNWYTSEQYTSARQHRLPATKSYSLLVDGIDDDN